MVDPSRSGDTIEVFLLKKIMAKDPAFLFYPNDYIGGTMGMTFEEKGAYIELLMLQFNRGHMTSHMIGQTIGQIWVNIKDKFEVDQEGLYFNKRLEEEQKKRKAYSDSRRNNKSGKNQYSKNKKPKGHMKGHMEDENENENKVKNEDQNEVKENVQLPFDSAKFLTHWVAWKDYKKIEFNFKYKSKISEQAALIKLNNLSNSEEKKAIEILTEAMAQGWKGFHNINKNDSGAIKKTTNLDPNSEEDKEWLFGES